VTGSELSGSSGPDLVPGELRGYRQFELRADGLYPLVHAEQPWDGALEHARCGAGRLHAAPSVDCKCGLYGWYLPGSATVAIGPASAVIAAQGRCILGDRGFRAERARIEAVALPMGSRWNPWAAARARRMLSDRYPATRVYRSSRRMLRDLPPHDLRGLGIEPPEDHSRGYRATGAVLWALVVALAYGLALLPRGRVADAVAHWWPVLVVVAVGWQAALVWLVARLLALQSPDWSGKRR
jgi:hypothetical protein